MMFHVKRHHSCWFLFLQAESLRRLFSWRAGQALRGQTPRPAKGAGEGLKALKGRG